MKSPKPWSDPTPVDGKLLAELKKGVVEYNEAIVVSTCNTIIDRRMDAYMAIFEGLVAGMERVGELFDSHEYFVPELLMCSDTLYAGLGLLRPHVSRREGAAASRGNVIIGTVEGDIHDIGKNMVRMVFEIAGFDVNDLGSDAPIKRFAREARLAESPLVLISVMMTTCIPNVKELISEVKKANPSALVMVGGAFLDQDSMKTFCADAGAPNAHQALRAAVEMIGAARKMESSPNAVKQLSVTKQHN